MSPAYIALGAGGSFECPVRPSHVVIVLGWRGLQNPVKYAVIKE